MRQVALPGPRRAPERGPRLQAAPEASAAVQGLRRGVRAGDHQPALLHPGLSAQVEGIYGGPAPTDQRGHGLPDSHGLPGDPSGVAGPDRPAALHGGIEMSSEDVDILAVLADLQARVARLEGLPAVLAKGRPFNDGEPVLV